MKALIASAKDVIFDTFFTPENIELANGLGEIIWNETDQKLNIEDVKDKISDCDVYVTTWSCPRLDNEILKYAPNIKLLCHLCGTVVPVVSEEMWQKGIRVISGNDYFAESVAEGTIAYILTSLREIPRYSYNLKVKKQWKNAADSTNGLLGKTVGIVSYGAIAKHLVRMLQVFKVKIKIYDIAPIPEEDKIKYGIEQVSLEELFATSDVVSVHTPYNDKTYHLIDKKLLSLIKDGGLFVNTSRGPVIDQAALVEELNTGRFSAVLDVYEKEPPEKDDPLYDCPNLIMIPHMGGPTTNLRQLITHDLLIEAKEFIDNVNELKHEITKAKAEQMSKG